MKLHIFPLLLFSMYLSTINSFPQDEKDMSIFLSPTEYINCDNKNIVAKAAEITKECNSEIDKMQKLFEYVRDSYTTSQSNSFIASDVLKNGGNSCYKRSVLLAALCRAVGIPSRLQYPSLLLKDFNVNGERKDYLFTHALTGVYLNGKWYLLEPVGNNAKWKVWAEKEELDEDMTVQFQPYKDCLFSSTDKVILKTLPIYFSDYSEDRYEVVRKIVMGEIGVDEEHSFH